MQSYTNTEKTTLRDYLRVLFRHKPVIIITLLTVMTTVFIGLKLKTPVYEAQTTMLITATTRVTSPYSRELRSFRDFGVLLTQSKIVKSRPVLEYTVKTLRLDQRPLDYEKQFSSKLKADLIDYRLKKLNARTGAMTPEEKEIFLFRTAIKSLDKNLEVKPIRDSNLFTITVTDFDPKEAARIANVISRAYIIFSLEMQLTEFQTKFGEKHSSTTQLRESITTMKENLNGEFLPNALAAIGPGSVKVVEQAVVPLQPLITNKLLIILLSLFVSGFLGSVLAFGFDYLDQTFKSHQDIKKFLNLPSLGSIPKRKSKDALLINIKQTLNSDYTRSYQSLSDQIYLLMRDKDLQSVLVTDAEASEDIAAVTANIGIYLAQKAGFRVLIIDANLRTPSLSTIFNISNSPGLTDVLEGKISFEDTIQNLGFSLYVLPAGETVFNPVSLLGSSIMSEVIKKAQEQYEIIFINCADLKNFSDALILSSVADGVILVVNEGKVERQVVKMAIAPLEQKEANLIGVILNNHRLVIPGTIYKLT